MSNIVWTESERRFIRENAGEMKDKAMALALSKSSGRFVTIHALRKQRQNMGISKRPGRGVCGVVGQIKGA